MFAVETQELYLVFAIGMCVGCLALPVAWVTLGRTRFSLRYIPAGIMIACSILIAIQVAPRELAFVWNVLVLGSILVATVLGMLIRFAGLRCLCEKKHSPVKVSDRVMLADFFWATLVIAVLAMCARQVLRLPLITGGTAWMAFVIISVICGALVQATTILALSKNSLLFYGGAAVCAFVGVVVVAVSWSAFVLGTRL